jgi:hypothetical protein
MNTGGKVAQGADMERSLASLLSISSGMALVSVLCLGQVPPAYLAGSLARQEPQPIYAVNPEDAWNRIFYLLFTRTVKLRLTGDFKEGAPLARVNTGTASPRQASLRTFERIESGDRAIDPLYPSFFNPAGVESVLANPRYGQFKKALQDALAEQVVRPPLHRALMQADVWAAFDIQHRDWGFSGELGVGLPPDP